MKLITGKPLIKPKYSDVYKFNLSFMIGDADGYENVVLFVHPSNPHLERFINFFKDCAKAYPHGRGGGDRDNYDRKVEDWALFCGENDLTNGDNFLEQLRFEWPYDQYGDCDTSFKKYTITYFDVDNIEYGVIVEV